MGVDVVMESGFATGRPRMLFESKYKQSGQRSDYDVAPDGQRFLTVKKKRTAGGSTDTTQRRLELV